MIHLYNLNDAHPDQPSTVTIGVFDGVHRGHQYLIRQLVAEAHAAGTRAVVITLHPHPDIVLRGQSGRYYLTTPDEKADLLGALGVDLVITHPFDDSARQVRAAAFVDDLRAHLDMKSLWVAGNFALGYKREGNFDFLREQGAEKGFAVVALDLLQNEAHGVINSTEIRAALNAGEVERAAGLLGRPYAISGEVIDGDKRGRTIGFPTANIAAWSEQIVPANGVYACRATLNGETFEAVTNIGSRPTFDGTGTRIEAHLLDFDRMIYGETLTVAFLERLRGEQKFSGIDALVAQIHADIESARTLFASMNKG